jgi:CheY-like chemotaxis protein
MTIRPFEVCSNASWPGMGHAIAETGESERAIEIISQEKPDVIILDVVMPGITGIEICRRLRQDPPAA